MQFRHLFRAGRQTQHYLLLGTGFTDKPRQKTFLLVDAATKTINNPGELSSPITSYGRWVDAMLAKDAYETIVQNKHTAFLVTNYLDNKEGDIKALDGVPAPLLASLLDANQTVVRRRIERQLTAKLPEPIAQRLYPIVASDMEPIELLDSNPGRVQHKGIARTPLRNL